MTALCEGGAALGFDDFSEASRLFFQRHRSHFGSERFNVYHPYSHQSLGLRVGFGTVMGECPFSVFYHGVQFGFGHHLFVNKQTKAPTERATFDRLGSADRLRP